METQVEQAQSTELEIVAGEAAAALRGVAAWLKTHADYTNDDPVIAGRVRHWFTTCNVTADAIEQTLDAETEPVDIPAQDTPASVLADAKRLAQSWTRYCEGEEGTPASVVEVLDRLARSLPARLDAIRAHAAGVKS